MGAKNQVGLDRLWDAVGRLIRLRAAMIAALVGIAVLCGAVAVKAGSGQNNEGAELDQDMLRGPSNAAIERFWTAYHGNDYAAIPEVEEQLEDAIQNDPKNPTLHALLGAAHFWHIGEAARDPNRLDPALVQDMPEAVSDFGKALDLDYYTPHFIGYINDDHLPGYLGITTVHLGQMTNDPDVIAKGDQMLDFAVYQFPEFNNFNRWAAHNTDSKDSESYNKALNSLWQGIDNCVGTRIDRTNPDLSPYLHLFTSVGRKKACWWGGEIAPYSFEGYLLNLGNGLVKAGQIDAAKVIYKDATLAGNYRTWPYRNVLETIAASDLNARAGLYADADSTNDPPLGVPNRSCSYCHARAPERGSR